MVRWNQFRRREAAEISEVMLAAAIALPMPAGHGAGQETGQPSRGFVLAQRLCAERHAIQKEYSRSPNPNAPRFQTVASIPGMTATALSLNTSHRAMPNIMLAADEQADIIAYILSLKMKFHPPWKRAAASRPDFKPGPIASVTDEHRNFRVRKHLRRHAAKHDCRNPAPSVRGHDDEVAASLRGGVYDALVRMILFDLHSFTDDTSRAGFFGDSIQYAPRVRFGALDVLGESVGHFIDSRSRNCVDIERRFNRQCGDFCSH
jgi:hypothetical protein